MQTLDQGMDAAKAEIAGCLHRNIPAARHRRPQRRGRPFQRTAAARNHNPGAGEIPETVEAQDQRPDPHADLLHGQKTGIFLDQRENYRAAAQYARGGNALDCFTSTGGFALHLAPPNANQSKPSTARKRALSTARANAAANDLSNIHFHEADVFDILAGHASARRQYSLVVLDPPAFAKSRRNLEPAIGGYKEINLRALRLLPPGGILVTCSCSHHLSESAFLELVAQASLDANRTLRVLERRTQSQDHPSS